MKNIHYKNIFRSLWETFNLKINLILNFASIIALYNYCEKFFDNYFYVNYLKNKLLFHFTRCTK